MEELSLRFQHIKEQIFQRLDISSLSKCRKVSIFWKKIIDEDKELWIQRIQIKTNRWKESVKTMLRKKTPENLVILANQIMEVSVMTVLEFHSEASKIQ